MKLILMIKVAFQFEKRSNGTNIYNIQNINEFLKWSKNHGFTKGYLKENYKGAYQWCLRYKKKYGINLMTSLPLGRKVLNFESVTNTIEEAKQQGISRGQFKNIDKYENSYKWALRYQKSTGEDILKPLGYKKKNYKNSNRPKITKEEVIKFLKKNEHFSEKAQVRNTDKSISHWLNRHNAWEELAPHLKSRFIITHEYLIDYFERNKHFTERAEVYRDNKTVNQWLYQNNAWEKYAPYLKTKKITEEQAKINLLYKAQNITDAYENYPGSVNLLKKLEIWEKYSQHLRENTQWNYSKALDSAKSDECVYISDFEKEFPGAHSWAKNNNVLDKIRKEAKLKPGFKGHLKAKAIKDGNVDTILYGIRITNVDLGLDVFKIGISTTYENRMRQHRRNDGKNNTKGIHLKVEEKFQWKMKLDKAIKMENRLKKVFKQLDYDFPEDIMISGRTDNELSFPLLEEEYNKVKSCEDLYNLYRKYL